MSEALNQFKEKASEAAVNAGRAAKLLAYISGHKLQIMHQRELIRRLYTRLGKVYYRDYVTNEEPDEAEYLPLCEEISCAYRTISRLRDEIAAAKEEYREQREGIELCPIEAPEEE